MYIGTIDMNGTEYHILDEEMKKTLHFIPESDYFDLGNGFWVNVGCQTWGELIKAIGYPFTFDWAYNQAYADELRRLQKSVNDRFLSGDSPITVYGDVWPYGHWIWKSELKAKFIQTINARFNEWQPVKWKMNGKMVFF